MPNYLRSVLRYRSRYGDPAGYLRWRREWPQFDRYVGEDGRASRVEAALTAAPDVGPRPAQRM
jgi:hypothetical protein